MKKCNPMAFARCPDKRFCESIEDAEFTEGSDCDMYNQSILAHPLTNADRILAMSDKELAKELVIITTDRCDICARYANCNNRCIGGVLEWLQQPAEDVP